MARLSPIWRGSRWTPPARAARPTRGSGRAKVAVSEATIRSQASAISKPPPIATPLTAAITGFGLSKREVSPAKPVRGISGFAPAPAWNLRSLPALKARSPAPVMIATQRSGSATNSSKTFSSSKFAGGWSAFITSGRFIVTTSRRPSRSARQNSGMSWPSRSPKIHRGHGRRRSERRRVDPRGAPGHQPRAQHRLLRVLRGDAGGAPPHGRRLALRSDAPLRDRADRGRGRRRSAPAGRASRRRLREPGGRRRPVPARARGRRAPLRPLRLRPARRLLGLPARPGRPHARGLLRPGGRDHRGRSLGGGLASPGPALELGGELLPLAVAGRQSRAQRLVLGLER